MDWNRHSLLRFLTAVVFIFGATTLSESVARAYPTPVDFNGRLLRWDIDPSKPLITYEIKAEDQSSLRVYRDLATQAAGIWSGVHSSFADYTEAKTGETAMVTIYYDSNIVGGETSAGYAEFDSSDDQGPLHCVIHIAAPLSIDWESLGKTTLHEMGHCLGLGHSVVAESIMSYRLDVNTFSLALDDEAAVSRLYPADGSTPKKPAGCVIGITQSREFRFLLLLLSSPLAIVLLRRRFLR